MRIELSNTHSGLVVEYTQKTRNVTVWGWYDDCAGIEGHTMPLREFISRLGVRKKHLLECFENPNSAADAARGATISPEDGC